MEKIHENPHCPHNNTPITQVRLRWLSGDYRGGLAAVQQQLRGQLEPRDRKSLEEHARICGVRLGEISLEQALQGSIEFRDWMTATGNPLYAIESHVVMIQLADELSDDLQLLNTLTGSFFVQHGRTPLTTAYYWLFTARRTLRWCGASPALPLFEAALESLPDDAPICLREAIVRIMGHALVTTGQRERFRTLLREVSVPVRDDNGEGEGKTLEALVFSPAV